MARRCRGEKASRSTAEVAQIHPTLLGRGGQPRGEVHCLVEFGCSDGGFLAHIAKNRHLSPGRDQGVGDPIDPDSSAAAIAAILPSDSLQSEDAVGARKLPEAQSHHAGVRCHVAILSLPTDLCPRVRTWLASFRRVPGRVRWLPEVSPRDAARRLFTGDAPRTGSWGCEQSARGASRRCSGRDSPDAHKGRSRTLRTENGAAAARRPADLRRPHKINTGTACCGGLVGIG